MGINEEIDFGNNYNYYNKDENINRNLTSYALSGGKIKRKIIKNISKKIKKKYYRKSKKSKKNRKNRKSKKNISKIIIKKYYK